MKIAISASEKDMTSKVDPRFGRAGYFLIYDLKSNVYEFVDNSQNLNAASGAGIQAAQNVLNQEVEALVTGNCGPKAFSVLNAANIKVYLGESLSLEEAVKEFKAGNLKSSDNANVEGHW
jgi:predicted Fe-Mo cluster-binding NifX family protein